MKAQSWEIKLSQIALSEPALIPDLLRAEILIDKELIQRLERISKLKSTFKDRLSPELIKAKLPEHLKPIADIQDVTQADKEYFYQELKNQTLEVFQNKTTFFQERYNNLEDYIREYKDTVFEPDKNSEDRINLNGSGAAAIIAKRYAEDLHQGISTGFDNLDNILAGGGWLAKNLYCILGLSGTGKSLFLTNFAGRLFEKARNILYITTEMDVPETGDRILRSMTSQKDSKAAVLAMQNKEKNKHTYSQYFELRKVHPNDISAIDIQYIIERELDFAPEVIIIDYADELRASEKTASDYENYKVVYSDLKKLAEVFYCPIITATQTNRQAASNEGGTQAFVGSNTIGDSWNKVKPLTGLFSIVQQKSDYESGLISLQVNKNRSGKSVGMLDFTINYQTLRIDTLTEAAKRAVEKKRENKNEDTKIARKRHSKIENRPKDWAEKSQNDFISDAEQRLMEG